MAQARIVNGDNTIEVDGLTAAAAAELILAAARKLRAAPRAGGDEQPRHPFGFTAGDVDEDQADAA